MFRKFTCLALLICATLHTQVEASPRLEVTRVALANHSDITKIPINDGEVELVFEHFGGDFNDATHFVYLSCYSSQPIEWISEEPTYNKAYTYDEYYERIDNWQTEPDGLAEIYLSQHAILVPVSSSTGKYTCRHTDTDQPSTTSVYLFVNTNQNGPIFFQPGHHHLLTSYPYYRNYDRYYISREQENSYVLLDFMSNQPGQGEMKIYKRTLQGALVQLPFGDNLLYDGNVGLRINLGWSEIGNEAFQYVYEVHADKREDPISFDFHLRKSFTVQPNVPRIDHGQTVDVELVCNAQNPIDIVLIEGELEDEDYTPTKSCTGADPSFTCTLTVNPSKYTYRTRWACRLSGSPDLLPPGDPTLHTWMFTRETEPVANIERVGDIITCCTNDHYEPYIQFINCHTFSECNLEKFEVAHADYTYDEDVVEKLNGTEACVRDTLRYPYAYSTINVACSVGPEGFTFAQYSNYNGTVVNIDRTRTPDGSFKILLEDSESNYYEPTGNIIAKVDDPIDLACAADRFFYGTPKLFVDFANGTSNEVEIECTANNSFGQNWHHCPMRLVISSEDVTAVSCRSGSLNVREKWISKTIKINFNSGTTLGISLVVTTLAFLLTKVV